MGTYKYSIYDANPASSSVSAWPSHDGIEIDAESDGEALDEVREVLEIEVCGLNVSDGYEVGQRIYATVQDVDTLIEVGPVTHELTAEDLA